MKSKGTNYAPKIYTLSSKPTTENALNFCKIGDFDFLDQWSDSGLYSSVDPFGSWVPPMIIALLRNLAIPPKWWLSNVEPIGAHSLPSKAWQALPLFSVRSAQAITLSSSTLTQDPFSSVKGRTGSCLTESLEGELIPTYGYSLTRLLDTIGCREDYFHRLSDTCHLCTHTGTFRLVLSWKFLQAQSRVPLLAPVHLVLVKNIEVFTWNTRYVVQVPREFDLRCLRLNITVRL